MAQAHADNVERVADTITRTGEVRVRESITVESLLCGSRAPVPRLRNTRQAYLRSPNGVGPHEDIAVAARTDLRVHEAC